MKIKNVDILSNDFLPAFERLMYRQMPAKQCLELAQCLDELTSHQNITRKARTVIIEKYAVKDKSNKVVSDGLGNAVFPNDKAMQKCMAELKEIDDDTVEINLTSKITIYDDEHVVPMHIKVLRDVISITPRPKMTPVEVN
jgi:hypothetical protein